MYIELSDAQAIIRHEQEHLTFSLREAYQSPQKSISRDPFAEINGWFKTLHPDRQKAIFNIYKAFRHELTTVTNIEYLADRMGSLAEALYKFVAENDLNTYVKLNNIIDIPAKEFPLAHEPNDPYPERTYTDAEYRELMLIVIALRPLFPVTFEYMAKLTSVYGKDYKEHYARLTLLAGTWIEDTPAIDRLKRYVVAVAEGKRDKISNVVFNAMSKEDFSDWVLSKVICRRLLTGEIHILPGVPHQVSSIFTFILNAPQQTPQVKGVGHVVMKDNSSKEYEDENKSYADEDRTRQNTTIGFIVSNTTGVEDTARLVRWIDSTVPDELIDAALSKRLTYGPGMISSWHTIISQLIIADVVSLRVLDILTKPSHVSVAECCRILLWHWGFPELSLLMSAECKQSEDDESELVMGLPVGVKPVIDEDSIIKINRIYQLGEHKLRPDKHPVLLNLIQLAKSIPDRLWEVRPIPGVTLPPTVDSNNNMNTPLDIVNQIVKLAVKLAEDRFKSMENSNV